MAIDRKGQVTTTGLMGGEPKLPKAPDMSGLGQKMYHKVVLKQHLYLLKQQNLQIKT